MSETEGEGGGGGGGVEKGVRLREGEVEKGVRLRGGGGLYMLCRMVPTDTLELR